MANLFSRYLSKKRSIAVEDSELSKVMRIVNKGQKNTKVKIDNNDQFNTSRYFITLYCNEDEWNRIKVNVVANHLNTVYTLETRYFKV